MRFTELPRPALLGLALLLAAASILYSALWMYYARWERPAWLGLRTEYLRAERALRVTEALPGSPALQAGFQTGDRIVIINGRTLTTPNPYWDAVARGKPGDPVQFGVERAGLFLNLQATLVKPIRIEEPVPFGEWLAAQLVNSYPVLFVVVGLPVLFLRLRDVNAWLLALLFSGFIAGAPLLLLEPAVHPSLRGFALFYKILGVGVTPALFYFFFAVFPEPSPLERRVPRLKWVFLIGSLLVVGPLAVWGLIAGSSQPLLGLAERLGGLGAREVILGYFFGGMLLGLASLVWSGLRAPSAETRRKLKVIVWGTVVGMLPFLLVFAAAIAMRRNYYDFPFWVWAPPVLLSFLIPLSMAYAVIKHRVLEVPVLLKRSARYLLVRRSVDLLLLLLAVVFYQLAAGVVDIGRETFLQVQPETTLISGVGIGMLFGAIFLAAHRSLQRRIGQRIDRAFFRSAYDARRILEELAEKLRAAGSREELATLLRQQIREALHPKTRYVYLEDSAGQLHAFRSDVPQEIATLPNNWPLLAELAREGKPREVSLEPEGYGRFWQSSFRRLDAVLDEMARLAPLEPECLVPLVGRGQRLVGLLVLGPRMSEEPYSGEDHRLLAAVATQAATALEGIRFAEQMAERLESERKTAHEIEIAQKVQRRLLPQKQPKLETLEYVGQCIQARAVGGDYYDYLDFGPGRLGLVLADIAGKGISAALLMANLQANLRSQYALALEDIPRLLRSVNRLFVENTEPAHYATAFFAVYDDAARRLRYENCGHNNPLLLRADGRAERLTGTATVLGMFDVWECSVSETQLQPGDLLVMYSDGVSEAQSDAGEFFGEERLLEATLANRHLPVEELVDALAQNVVTFSGREKEDDITLLVARCR